MLNISTLCRNQVFETFSHEDRFPRRPGNWTEYPGISEKNTFHSCFVIFYSSVCDFRLKVLILISLI